MILTETERAITTEKANAVMHLSLGGFSRQTGLTSDERDITARANATRKAGE